MTFRLPGWPFSPVTDLTGVFETGAVTGLLSTRAFFSAADVASGIIFSAGAAATASVASPETAGMGAGATDAGVKGAFDGARVERAVAGFRDWGASTVVGANAFSSAGPFVPAGAVWCERMKDLTCG